MPDVKTTHPTDQQLTDYGLGKLPAAQVSAIHQHLVACPVCRAKVEKQARDSFIGQLRAAGRGGAQSATPPPSASNTALPVRKAPPDKTCDDVPAELAASSKYEILGKLGQGGMGSVYKARHTFLDELVAIKVMNADVVADPEARSRFLREMKAAGKLKHPNIVRALDAEQVGDVLVLVMELVPGITLEQLVKQRGALPVDFACNCIVQAAEGLQHAHEKGMVHRDIKPANLMVSPKEQAIKVLDFGLARGPREQNSRAKQTALETFMGTPEYVAPEQAVDARSADIRADVYSLGCSLYYLLAGRPPFQADTPMNTIIAQIQDEAQPLSNLREDVPARLWGVVTKMMAKKPAARYHTPVEVARALEPFVSGEAKARQAEAAPRRGVKSVSIPPPPRVQPAAKPPRVVGSLFAVAATGARPRKGKRSAWGVWVAVAASLVTVSLVALVLALNTSKRKVDGEIDQKDAQVSKAVGPGKMQTTKQGAPRPPVRPVTAPAPEPAKPPEATKPPEPKAVAATPPPTEIINSIGMKLMHIPAGKFLMGATNEEHDVAIQDFEKWFRRKPSAMILGLYRTEKPQHEVEITKEFWMGIHEVTQKEFKEVMGYNPSYFSLEGTGKSGLKYLGHSKPAEGKNKFFADTSDFPVENVSHAEAEEFCKQLTALATETKSRRLYRLPTEAEWEYACRGGVDPYQTFHFGNTLSSTQANFLGDHPYSADKGPVLARTSKVGSYNKNHFGLYDMHGNVWEWCQDWYGKDYYGKCGRENPLGPSGGSERVMRGGSWSHFGQDCRSANRFSSTPATRISTVGFRVVLVVQSK